MKQRTVKRGVEALYWINNNSHHEVGLEFNKDNVETHQYFKNYHEKIRVPIGLMREEVSPYIRPNKRKFDTRMFALTAKGKNMVESR